MPECISARTHRTPVSILPIHYSAARLPIEKEPRSGCVSECARVPLLHFPASPFGFVLRDGNSGLSSPAALASAPAVNEFSAAARRPQQQQPGCRLTSQKLLGKLLFCARVINLGRPLALNKRDKSAV